MAYANQSWGHTGTVENTHAMVVHRPDGMTWSILVSGNYPRTPDLAGIFQDAIDQAGIDAPHRRPRRRRRPRRQRHRRHRRCRLHRRRPAGEESAREVAGCRSASPRRGSRPLLRRWWLVVAIGVAIAAVGVILVLSPFGTVKVLAVVVAFGLARRLVTSLAQAERHEVRWRSYALGAIWIAAAIAALVWPDVTLWALAIVVGIGLLAGGIAEVLFAFRYRVSCRVGDCGGSTGCSASSSGSSPWRGRRRSVVVLAVLFGIRLVLRGRATISFGLGSATNQMTALRVPT